MSQIFLYITYYHLFLQSYLNEKKDKQFTFSIMIFILENTTHDYMTFSLFCLSFLSSNNKLIGFLLQFTPQMLIYIVYFFQ